MDDYEAPLGHDHAGLIPQCRRNTFDQIEEALAAGLDMRSKASRTRALFRDFLVRLISSSGFRAVVLVGRRGPCTQDQRLAARGNLRGDSAVVGSPPRPHGCLF